MYSDEMDMLFSFSMLPNFNRYSYANGTASDYIQSLLTHYQPKQALRSADKGSRVVPRSNTISYGVRAFSRFAPFHFNQLPQNVSQ